VNNPSITLITLGCIFLVALLTDEIGRRTFLPRVTLLLLFGFIVGPSVFNLLPPMSGPWYTTVADTALVMVGFLLGGELTLRNLKVQGRRVVWISLTVVIMTLVVEAAGLGLFGTGFEVALLLAAIATATDPLAVSDVVHQTGTGGPFAKTLLGVVAIDDVWGLLGFSLMLTVAGLDSGVQFGPGPLLGALREIGGAVMLGAVIGVPAAYLTGRVRPGEPTLMEALGIVFVTGGLAIWLQLSFLLATMVVGAVVANLARHHTRAFRAIEGIELPFMILFFVFTGASLSFNSLAGIGWVTLLYGVLRVGGRFAGGWLGSRLCGAEPSFRRWMGLALLPQAGVALGMALVASQRWPDVGRVILPVVITSTVFFEVVGPVLTRIALLRSAPPPGRETGGRAPTISVHKGYPDPGPGDSMGATWPSSGGADR